MPSTKPPKLTAQAQRRAFEQLRDLLDHPDASLDWHYRVGLLVTKLTPRDKSQRKARGMVALLQKLGLPRHNESLLFATRKFVTHFSREDLADLEGLHWNHVHYLLGVEDSRERKKLLKRCRDEKLSCKNLRLMIREKHAKRSQGGRRPAAIAPPGPMGVLRETIRLSELWIQTCSQWLAENQPALEQAASRRRRDPELAELLGQAAETLARLRKEVEKRRKEMARLASGRS